MIKSRKGYQFHKQNDCFRFVDEPVVMSIYVNSGAGSAGLRRDTVRVIQSKVELTHIVCGFQISERSRKNFSKKRVAFYGPWPVFVRKKIVVEFNLRDQF